MLPEDPPSIGTLQINDLLDLIESVDEHIGGGAAAAISGSLAASTAILVVTLNARRRRNQARINQIESDLERLGKLRSELLTAGEDDMRALSDLMAVYRGTDSEALSLALEQAAGSSLEIGSLAVELLRIIARQAPLASRFTVSDLGAAAALAGAAVEAAALTAAVNIALLEDPKQGAESSIAEELDTRLQRLRSEGRALAEAAVARTAELIG